MSKYAQPLRIFSLVLAGIGFLVAQELNRREIEEEVEKALDRRESTKKDSYRIYTPGPGPTES